MDVTHFHFGRRLITTLLCVHDKSKYQQVMSNSNFHRALFIQLMFEISSQPEILLFFLRFHKEVSKMGISATSTRKFTGAQVGKYSALFAMELVNVHNVFCTQCQYFNILLHIRERPQVCISARLHRYP
mgnify:CR=1 FL=1